MQSAMQVLLKVIFKIFIQVPPVRFMYIPYYHAYTLSCEPYKNLTAKYFYKTSQFFVHFICVMLVRVSIAQNLNMTSCAGVNAAIYIRSVHKSSFKRSAFAFVDCNKLCR